MDRFDQALDAYKHYIALKPAEPAPIVGAANVLLKLRRYADARSHAELAAKVAGDADARAQASAHELLARVALAQRDFETARTEAQRASELDGSAPTAPFIEGRILYEQGHYDEAVPHFEQAIAELRNPQSRAIADLYYYAGDTLGRLERYHDAEVAFREELRLFPLNARARAGLAMLYQATDRRDEAAQTIQEMLRATPSPDTYALAARLYTMFGQRREADAVRTEARRTFGAASRGTTSHP